MSLPAKDMIGAYINSSHFFHIPLSISKNLKRYGSYLTYKHLLNEWITKTSCKICQSSWEGTVRNLVWLCFFFHISFFIKTLLEASLENSVSQKLLTSSFSNFKHEKTSLSVILHSLQAPKNWNHPKVLFKIKEKQQTISKGNWTKTTDCANVHISRQLRSAGQSVQ